MNWRNKQHSALSITICGGGNLGHVLGGWLSAQHGCTVSILTRRPHLWSDSLRISLPDGSHTEGRLHRISAQPSEVIPQADIIFICLPGPQIYAELARIQPFLSASTPVGAVVSSTGFFFQAHQLMPSQPLFGFQRVPFISRVETYGRSAALLGFKKELLAYVENTVEADAFLHTLSTLLDTPIMMAENFYEVSLSNSNPLLHTARLFSMWKDHAEGMVYPRQTYFYREWTVEASELYISMDMEFQTLLHHLNVRENSIPDVLTYYESTDATSLTSKIHSIPAFQNILSPMLQTASGWAPDFNSRYFTEDFLFGLKFIHQLAHQHSIPCPNIDMVYEWGVLM